MRMIAVMTGLIFLVSMTYLALAQEGKEAAKEEVKHEYVGVKVCKLCHTKDGIYPSWEKTKHATAYDSLTEAQKKEKGIDAYYTTGKLPDGTLLTNIQCEACHGPGSDYKMISIMKDKEKAMANGLNLPTAETCQKCHNENAPTEALKATVKGFDFEKMKAKVHVMPYPMEEKTEE
jgi:hypothetical protein